jgi:hypothetical protein
VGSSCSCTTSTWKPVITTTITTSTVGSSRPRATATHRHCAWRADPTWRRRRARSRCLGFPADHYAGRPQESKQRVSRRVLCFTRSRRPTRSPYMLQQPGHRDDQRRSPMPPPRSPMPPRPTMPPRWPPMTCDPYMLQQLHLPITNQPPIEPTTDNHRHSETRVSERAERLCHERLALVMSC